MPSSEDLPVGCVMGVNYSGMHDSAITILSADGDILFALSLERITRLKQDGRTLERIFDHVPWKKISRVAVSAPKSLASYESVESSLLTIKLSYERDPKVLAHPPAFLKAFDKVPCHIDFHGHQQSHAASALFCSGFQEAACLTYDGGMANDYYFGGFFELKNSVIDVLDRFDAVNYSKITTIYTFVTALLGFIPVRHEGKITGLAAYGTVNDKILELLHNWMTIEYFDVERSLYWLNAYSKNLIPQLNPNIAHLDQFKDVITEAKFKREDIAASVQFYAEQHVLSIFGKAKDLGWCSGNICLAGGLFANVKINQKVSELGFDNVFVTPPMTDDGTSLGAALISTSRNEEFVPKQITSMSLGPSFDADEVFKLLEKHKIKTWESPNPALQIAKQLSNDEIVAVFQGRMEFGPRALGNRSILASATRNDINERINKMLRRTEYMPFAPMIREEDAIYCCENFENVRLSSKFMTVTLNCTEKLKQTCPAVVHVDGTARPQIVARRDNPFVHSLLTEYVGIAGKHAIVNTSFNIHEEPIVCTPLDALKGFFEAGFDHLYIGGVGFISYADNRHVALEFVQQRIGKKRDRETRLEEQVEYLDRKTKQLADWLENASRDLIERTEDLVATRETLVERTVRLEKCVEELNKQSDPPNSNKR